MTKTKVKNKSKVNAIKIGKEIEQLRIKLQKSEVDIPINTELTLKQANYMLQRNNYSEAKKLYKLVLKHNPKHVDALIFLGNLSDDQHHYKDAIRWYDKALKIEPKNVDALCNKAVSLYNKSKFREAIKYYDKALKIDKDDVISLFGKSLSLFLFGRI